jgi:hypothetical protein
VYSAGQTVPSTAQMRVEGNNTKCVGKKKFNEYREITFVDSKMKVKWRNDGLRQNRAVIDCNTTF